MNNESYVDDPHVFQFLAREEAIKQRQKALADEMRQKFLRDQQGIQVDGNIVGGRYISSPFQVMAQGLEPGQRSERIKTIEAAIQKQQTEYQQADQAATARHIASRPQVQPGLPGPVDPNNPNALGQYTPTTQDKLNWAARGLPIPSRRETIQKYMEDLEIREPIREEARADRAANREDVQAARAEERRLMDQLGRDRLTDAAFDQQYRREETRRHNQAMEEAKRQATADAKAARENKPQPERRRTIEEEVDKATRIEEAKAGVKAKSEAAKEQADATESLQLISQAKALVGKATSSKLGAKLDEYGRAIGVSPWGADEAAQLKVLSGLLVSKVPKLSGPQSDADKLLYQQMAGSLGNDDIPVSQKLKAIETMETIYKRSGGVKKYNPATGKLE